MNNINNNYPTFVKEISKCFTQNQDSSINDIASETKIFFDSACQVASTEGLAKKHLKNSLSPSVNSFIEANETKAFSTRTLQSVKTQDKDRLKTLAGIYNTHYKENTEKTPNNLFTLMLTKGTNWEAQTKSLQLKVSKAIDLKRSYDLKLALLFVVLSYLAFFYALLTEDLKAPRNGSPPQTLLTCCLTAASTLYLFFGVLIEPNQKKS